MKALTTAYHGPTNTRGSRVSAKCGAGRVSIEWDDALNSDANHDAAARALLTKLKWTGTWARGSVADNAPGYVYVDTRDSITV